MSNKAKKISFLSALVIIVGSTIGAGIFFMNGQILSNVNGSLWLAIAAWVISGVGVIAIGLALVEMSSASDNNKGILGWTKNFTSKLMNKSSINYMLLVYLPTNMIILPLFAVMSLQDAGSFINWSSWTSGGIAFGIFVWFTVLGYISLKTSEKVTWVLTAVKFVPLLMAPILSLIDISNNGAVDSIKAPSATGLAGLSPVLGLFAALPAIMFAFDGFYAVTALKKELKDEKKIGTIVVIGLAILTVLYIVFSVLMISGGHGDVTGFGKNEVIIINSLIFVSVVGLINGFTMMQWRMYSNTAKDGDFKILVWFKEKFKIKSLDLAAVLFILTLGTILYIIVLLIGGYVWTDKTLHGYYGNAGDTYGLITSIASFTSLAVFAIIGGSIIGALINRKTKVINVKKEKYFIVAAWVSLIFIFSSVLVYVVISIVNMFGVNGANVTVAVVNFGIFLTTMLVSIVPAYIGNRKEKIKSA